MWRNVLDWLQEAPDASAVALLGRLEEAEPDRFSRTHLRTLQRTLQRRVQQWRGIMASELVYAASEVTLADDHGMPEMALAVGPPSAEFSVTFLDEATGTGKYG